MGETTCLMQVQTFCYAPGLPIEASECNPLHALGQSISFGRFISESLDWEKWSTFNSNSKRYVEEAERYSRPGSVAQKKAFFEAHYKKIAARKTAALLEQASNSVETEGPLDNNTAAIQDSRKALSEEGENQVLNSETEVAVKANGCELYDLNIEGNAPKRESSESESESKVCAGNPTEVEFQNQPEDNLNHLEKDEKQNSNYVPEEVTLITTEKPSAVPLENKGTPNLHTLPAIPGAPISSTKKVDAAVPLENKGTPNLHTLPAIPRAPIPPTKKVDAAVPLENKGTPSLHNLPAIPGAPTSSTKKVDAAVPSSLHTLPAIPGAPISSTKKVDAAVPLENKGTPSLHTLPAIPGAPISSTKKVDAAPASKKLIVTSTEKKRTPQKSIFMSVNFSPLRELNRLTASVVKKIKKSRVCSSSSRASEVCPTPLRTPTTAFENESEKYSLVAPSTMSTHLSSSSEERAARRKKEKAKSGTWKLEQAFCFKARALTEFHEESKESKNVMKQVPMSNFEQLNEEEISTRSVIDSKSSVPSHRPSNINGSAKHFQAKNGQSHTTTPNSTTAAYENS